MTTTIDTVEFLGKALTLITTDTQRLVAMRPICEGIGLDWKAQLDRIKRDEVLSTSVVMMTTQLPGDSQTRSVACLPLDMLNGWLFGVEVRRCRQAIRPALIRYKSECYAALAAYWQKRAVPAPVADDQLELARRAQGFAQDNVVALLEGHRFMAAVVNGRLSMQSIPPRAGVVEPESLHHWIEDPGLLEREDLERVAMAALRRLESAGGQHAIRKLLSALDPNYLLVLESELILSLYGSPAVYDKLARGGRDD